GVGLPLLFSNAPPPYHVDTTLVIALGLAIATFWAFVTSKGIAARRRPVQSGPTTIVGMSGRMRDRGFVLVGGELWHAHSSNGSEIESGQDGRRAPLTGPA